MADDNQTDTEDTTGAIPTGEDTGSNAETAGGSQDESSGPAIPAGGSDQGANPMEGNPAEGAAPPQRGRKPIHDLWELAHRMLAYGMQKNGMGSGNNSQGRGDTGDNTAPVTADPDQQGGAIPDNPDTGSGAKGGAGVHDIESGLGAIGQWAGRNSPEQQGGNAQTAGGGQDESSGPARDTSFKWDSSKAKEGPATAATKSIWKYLMGADAMSPTVKGAIENAVDPKGATDPNSRGLQAIKYAHDKHGPDAGFAAVQAYRREFDASKGFAIAAFEKGNVPSALDAANRAFQNVPGPAAVTFRQGQAGTINALVTNEDGNTSTYPLQPKSFQDLLKTHGGFDHLMLAGVEPLMKTLSQPVQQAAQQRQGVLAAAAQPGGITPPASGAGPSQPAPQSAPQSAPQPTRGGPNADLPILQAPKGVDQNTYDAAMRMFPYVSQSAQREQWIQQQVQGNQDKASKERTTQQGNQSKENVARINAEGRNQMWDTRGQHGENMAKIRGEYAGKAVDAKAKSAMQTKLLEIHTRAKTEEDKQHALLLNSIIKNAPLGLDLDTLDQQLKKYGGGVDQLLSGGQSPTAQPPRTATPNVQAPAASKGSAPNSSGSPAGRWVFGPGGKPVWQAQANQAPPKE